MDITAEEGEVCRHKILLVHSKRQTHNNVIWNQKGKKTW